MGADMPDVAPMATTKKLVSMNSLTARPKLAKVAKRTQDHLVDDALKDSFSDTFQVYINIVILCLE